MIELQGIEKTYGSGTVETPVLKGISFKIEAGEYVAIMGASGTGKSTLMNILGCLDKPTGGHYRLDDTDMVNLNDDALSHLRNHKIGFVFQQFHLLDRATALRNVLLPLIYANEYPEDARQRAEKALTAVGLSRHPRMCMSVLFPVPEAPMMAQYSPASILNEIPFRTWVSTAPLV